MLKRYLHLDLPKGQSLFLWGARKTGKSTFLKETYKDSVYYDFLKSEDYLFYSRAPHLIRNEILKLPEEKRITPIILDEIQKIPEVLDEVHWMIENIPGTSFILCGSSLRKLKHSGANLLGGRSWRQLFTPLVYPELPTFDLLRIFNNGLLPSHYLSETSPIRSLQGYVVDYLIPEIQWESRIRQLGAFNRFLEAIAFSHGEMVNFSNVARECGVTVRTVQLYFELIIEMLIGFMVPPFAKAKSRQLITHKPKFYFFDPGMIHSLIDRQIKQLRGPEAGKALEHYVFLELVGYKELNNLTYDINYWRTKSGLEVDFVLNRGKFAIEVKLSTPVEKRDIQGLVEFAKDYNPEKVCVVSLEPRKRLMIIEGIEISVYPIQDFLEDLWAGKIIPSQQ
jgi:predicted AAA+ superfamily ATPase